MELRSEPKANISTVSLENDTEARLFTTEGLGLFSIKGIKLAFGVMGAQADDKWPVEVTMSNRRLSHARDRMFMEAARLSAFWTLHGIGDYPDAVENEFALREMVMTIDDEFEQSQSFPRPYEIIAL